MEVKTLTKTDNNNDLSYIVLMDLIRAEDFKDGYDEFDINPTKRNIMHNILYNDLIANGTRIMVEDREIYSKIYTFDKYKDCKYDDSFDSSINEVNFSSMLDKDLWAYMYGSYLMAERLSVELMGFAAIQI
jgi:hypothetical protein